MEQPPIHPSEYESHRRAVQPLLGQGWTPGQLLWLAQKKLHDRGIGELGGTTAILTDPETLKLSKTCQIIRHLYPGVEPEEPPKRK